MTRCEAARAMAERLYGVEFHGGNHGNMHALCEALAGEPFVGTVEACERLRDNVADVLGHCPKSDGTCPDGDGPCPILSGSSEVRAGSSNAPDIVATETRQPVADDGVARSNDGVGPVTAELRQRTECLVTFTEWSLHGFHELCDAVDALHRNLENENARLRSGRDRMADELARVMAERDELRDELEAEREENVAWHESCTSMTTMIVRQYTKLPEDANGEVIRVGDTMRYADYRMDANRVGTFRVESMHLLADGSWMVMDDGPLCDHAPQMLVHTTRRRELLRELVARSMGIDRYVNGVAVLEVVDDFFDEFLEEHPELLGGDE